MSESQAAQAHPLRQAASAIGIIIVSVLVTLGGLEVALRVWFTLFGSEADRATYLYSVQETLDNAALFEGAPYINYGLSTIRYEINERGYRSPDMLTPKPEGTFRIFTLGGSTTYGTGLERNETYPLQLQNILHEQYGYTHVEVINAGVEAYSSFDSLANLIYHVLDDEPDLILIYDGINDVRARLVDPAYYDGMNRQRGIWSPAELENRRSLFVLVRLIQQQLGAGFNPNSWESALAVADDIVRCPFHLTFCDELGMSAADVLAANPPIYFERNLRNMVAIAQANGAEVVFSTWAYFPEETPLPNFLMVEHIQNAVDEQNEMVIRLGDTLDVPVIDLASTLPYNVDFWQDGMHVTAAGAREQAEIYAAYLVENNLLPPAGE